MRSLYYKRMHTFEAKKQSTKGENPRQNPALGCQQSLLFLNLSQRAIVEFCIVAQEDDGQSFRILSSGGRNDFDDGLRFIYRARDDDDSDLEELSDCHKGKVIAPCARQTHEAAVVVPAGVVVTKLFQLRSVLQLHITVTSQPMHRICSDKGCMVEILVQLI